MEAEIEERGAVRQLTRQPNVLAGRGRISGGVIVYEDESCRADPERRPQNFSGMHEGGRLGAGRDEGVHEVMVLGVEEDNPEVLFVVIGCSEEVPSEEGDGVGGPQDSWRRLAGLTVDNPGGDLQAVPHGHQFRAIATVPPWGRPLPGHPQPSDGDLLNHC